MGDVLIIDFSCGKNNEFFHGAESTPKPAVQTVKKRNQNHTQGSAAPKLLPQAQICSTRPVILLIHRPAT